MATTPTPQTPAEIDNTRIDAFVGQFLTDLAGGATTMITLIGPRLGLYDAMTDAGPVAAEALAASTGFDERLVSEWLTAQTVSGCLDHDPRARTYELPAEHAMVLSVADSPAYLVAATEYGAAQHAFGTSARTRSPRRRRHRLGRVPRELFAASQRYFATAYTHELTSRWLAAVDRLVEDPIGNPSVRLDYAISTSLAPPRRRHSLAAMRRAPRGGPLSDCTRWPTPGSPIRPASRTPA